MHFAQGKWGKNSNMDQNGVVHLHMHFDASLWLDRIKLGTEGWICNPQGYFHLRK